MDGRPRWAPRVPQNKIRRLYESDAAGMLDEELLDDVAYAIWERCRDIITVTEAHAGRVSCPSCEAILAQEDELICACGWRLAWADYHASYRRKQLHGGGAIGFFEEYVDGFERARAPRDKMLLIDRLLHRFHHELGERPSRVAAVNVIGGKMHDVAALLEDLARADDSNLAANRADYERNKARANRIWGKLGEPR